MLPLGNGATDDECSILNMPLRNKSCGLDRKTQWFYFTRLFFGQNRKTQFQLIYQNLVQKLKNSVFQKFLWCECSDKFPKKPATYM